MSWLRRRRPFRVHINDAHVLYQAIESVQVNHERTHSGASGPPAGPWVLTVRTVSGVEHRKVMPDQQAAEELLYDFLTELSIWSERST